MPDENKTENPYQPPASSVEPLVKKDADGPKAKPHPFHWWIPWLGYGCVTLMVGLMFTINDRSFEGYHIFVYCEFALLFLLPVYGLAILGLTAQRILRKTNSVGLTLFQLLSMVLPTLLLILWLDVHFRSPV